MSVELQGSDQFALLARTLKAAGEKGLQRELNKAINDAMKPVRRAVKQSALADLPRHGGLNEKIAKSTFRTVKRTSVRGGAGVRLTVSNAYALRQLDRGRLRHPVFADSSKTRKQWTWVNQQVEPGWWTNPIEDVGPEARAAVEAAVRKVAGELSGVRTSLRITFRSLRRS